MKIKIKNILILLFGILVFGAIFCTNQVKAEDISKEYILSLIPDEMDVDLPGDKYDYEKAHSNVLEKIKKILEDNEIQCEFVKEDGYLEENIRIKIKDGKGTRINVTGEWHPVLYKYLSNVGIYNDSEDIGKKVKFNYKGYSLEDEKYIKSLNLKIPYYCEIDIEKLNDLHQYTLGFEQDMADEVGKYLENLINDKSLEIKTVCYGGSAFSAGYYIAIFKNGFLYDLREDKEQDTTFIPVINVPSNINDNDLKDYIKEQLNNKYTNILLNKNFDTIKKGAKLDNVDIIDGYTMTSTTPEGSQYEEIIIINRNTENGIYTDTETNIKLDTTTSAVPQNTRIIAKNVTEGNSYNIAVKALGKSVDKFSLYDITLKCNGETIQPNGKVKISIPIPEGFDIEKLVVYRIVDSEKIKYDVNIEKIDGKDYATFETDHFSLYTLAIEKTIKELDQTPKTGNVNLEIYPFITITIISLIVAIILKKNK